MNTYISLWFEIDNKSFFTKHVLEKFLYGICKPYMYLPTNNDFNYVEIDLSKLTDEISIKKVVFLKELGYQVNKNLQWFETNKFIEPDDFSNYYKLFKQIAINEQPNLGKLL